MAFTLYREKNGQRIPIKVSVLDVFRDPPRPKPKVTARTQTIQSSNDSHPKANVAEKMVPPAVLGAQANHMYTPPPIVNPYSPSAPEVWSAEDDAKLIELKHAGKSWNQIREVLGKESKSEVSQRWKVIQPKESDEKQADKKEKQGDERRAIAEKKKTEGLAKAKAKTQVKTNNQKETKNEPDQTTKTDHQKPQVTEHNINSFAARYDKDKWLALASRHYDRTGQRISVQQAKEMYEGQH